MIVSPLDYELYSRVTGQPIPMSAAERMKMAPVVNEFTKNYTKAQNRQSMGRNILKIGALGALGAAAYYGSRNFGTPSQELGQEITETSTGSNLIQSAADNAAASASTDTIADSLTRSGDQNPQQTEENAVATTSEPSQLNINTSMETGVKKPTPNIDAALERRSVKLPSATTIREKYNRYETTPQKQQKGAEQTLVGGGSIYISDREGKVGETIKTEDSSGFDDKGKSILNKYVGMMKDGVDENLKELTGPTAPDFEQTLVSDSSPLAGHPDMPPGEDDIFQHGGTNTSPTTNLAYLDPKKVLAMSVAVGKEQFVNPSKPEARLSPEEKLVIASEVEKRRTPNPLEQRTTPRSPNELAGKDQAAFEAIQAGIPQEEQEAAAKRVKEKTTRKRAQSATEKVDEFTSKIMPKEKSSFVESMSMDLSADKTPTATFNLNQKGGGTKPYSVEISTPMAVSLNEMAEDGSLQEESMGKMFNMALDDIDENRKVRKAGQAFRGLFRPVDGQ
jgi:hypothetical protein